MSVSSRRKHGPYDSILHEISSIYSSSTDTLTFNTFISLPHSPNLLKSSVCVWCIKYSPKNHITGVQKVRQVHYTIRFVYPEKKSSNKIIFRQVVYFFVRGLRPIIEKPDLDIFIFLINK